MFKKLFTIIITATLALSMATSAFAVFQDLELIRVYYDRNGAEIATDLGKVSDLVNSVTPANTPTNTIFGSFGSLTTGYVVYFALDRTNTDLWASNSTTTAPLVIGGTYGLTSINAGTTSMYSTYNDQGGTNYTGVASYPNSYKNKLSSTQGWLANTITGVAAREATELSLATLSTNNTQILYYWNNAKAGTTDTIGRTGVAVATITTNANGSTTISAPPAAATAPGAPIIGTASTAGDGQAKVYFTAPGSNGGSAITSYTATSTPDGKTVTGAGSPLIVSGLTPGTSYTFSVKATNAAGLTGTSSGSSNPVIPTGMIDQTITFGAAPTVVVGSSATISASGGASGNAVTFSASPASICTVSNGNSVNGIAAGTCAITANQAGNATYNAASPVTLDITVDMGSQTIVFGAAPTVVVGGSGAVSASGGASGNAVTFSASPASVCTVTNGNSVNGIAVGACSITANQVGNANYNAASPVTQNITVVKTGQTLTFGAAPTVVIGDSGTASASGGASGNAVTFSASPASICTASGTNGSTINGVSAGTCTITANQTGNTNYNAASPATQNIIVGKGSQTIISFAFSPNSVNVGDVTTASATGGASGNVVTFSSNTTSVCTVGGTNGSTITIKTSGTCTITANQAGNTNYNAATPVTQDIIVGLVGQTITFGAAPTVVVGGSGAVSASGGASGNAVTFSASPASVCTITNGNSVNGIAVGICAITANQAENDNYNAAAPVTQNITVGKGSQTITFGVAPTVVVGGSGTVSASGSASGNAVTFSASPASVCTVTNGNSVNGIAAGACAITANQAENANYNAAAPVTQNISVGKGSQTITFGAPPIVAMGGSGTLNASGGASGNAVTFSSNTTSVCTVSDANGSTVNGIAFGACTIVANQVGNANYEVASPVTLNIVIGKSAQTIGAITFNPPTLMTGGATTVSATSSSGLPVTFSSYPASVCIVSDTTVTGVGAGTCIITANQAGSANYGAASPVTQDLSVGKGNQTIGTVTFNPPKLAVGGTSIVSATSSSGLEVTFSSTTQNVCTVTGTTIIGISTGACSIVAGQAGNSSYNAAYPVTQTIAAAIPPISFTVTSKAKADANADTNANGTVFPASQIAEVGKTVSFTVQPGPGYQIAAVSGCNGSLNGNTYTTSGIISNCTVTASFIATPAKKGDLTGEGDVDIKDALMAMKIIAGLIPQSAKYLAAAPISSANGKINIADVVAILRLSVGLPI
ncbi:MAG: fibronectin type III domain-containing protein [Pedobacter sp.]